MFSKFQLLTYSSGIHYEFKCFMKIESEALITPTRGMVQGHHDYRVGSVFHEKTGLGLSTVFF